MRDMKHDHTKPRTYLGLFPRSSQGLDAVTSGGCPQLQSRRAKAGVLTRCLCPRVRVEISVAPPSSHRNQLRTFVVSHLSSIYSALLSKAAPRFSLQEEFLSSWASWWGCHSSCCLWQGLAPKVLPPPGLGAWSGATESWTRGWSALPAVVGPSTVPKDLPWRALYHP